MDKIKRYIDCYIPTETCNLRCHYCYISQQKKFNKKLASFSHSPETIRKALSKERLGGTCLLNMCAGGETLLSSEILPVVKELLMEGHYVMIVTNGTITKRFEEIATWPKELLKHLFFKFSFHFLEMKRLNWMDRFFSNVQMMKEAGASFTVEITPSDELIPYIDEVKTISMEKMGALPHITIARDDRTNGIDVLSKLPFNEYIKVWGQFDSALFDFKTTIFYKKRKEFCYAGDWTGYLNLDSGSLRQCYCGKTIDNIYHNLDQPLHFEAMGCECSIAHCYNGHSWIALGDIPSITAPTYAEERNRVCTDGTEWLKPEMKSFMSGRLYEQNKEYSAVEKAKHYVRAKGGVRGVLAQSKTYQGLSRIKHSMLKDRK